MRLDVTFASDLEKLNEINWLYGQTLNLSTLSDLIEVGRL